MKTISVSEARKHLPDILEQEEQVILINNGKIVGIIIPFNVEDTIDIIAAKKAMTETNFVAWKDAKKELNL